MGVVQQSTNSETGTKAIPLTAATKTISLKGVLKGEIPTNNKPKQPEVVAETATTPNQKADQFTQEQLSATWGGFAQSLEKQKPSIFTIMSDCIPVLCDNFEVDIEVKTQVQIDLLQEITQDLLTHLKSTLNNTQISLNYKIGTVEKSNKPSMYTSHDKLKFMVQKNPALLDLMEKLKLSLD